MATFAGRRLAEMVENTACRAGTYGRMRGINPLRPKSCRSSKPNSPPSASAFLHRPDIFFAPTIEAMRTWARQSQWPAAVQAILPSHA
jgi:histidine ammonia-lyase